MIRKYLVCGKQMFVTSKKLDEANQKVPVCELLLPIQLYWELEALVKRLEYMIASHEDQVVINEMNQKIMRKAVKYVVNEKDRAMLQARLHGTA